MKIILLSRSESDDVIDIKPHDTVTIQTSSETLPVFVSQKTLTNKPSDENMITNSFTLDTSVTINKESTLNLLTD